MQLKASISFKNFSRKYNKFINKNTIKSSYLQYGADINNNVRNYYSFIQVSSTYYLFFFYFCLRKFNI